MVDWRPAALIGGVAAIVTAQAVGARTIMVASLKAARVIAKRVPGGVSVLKLPARAGLLLVSEAAKAIGPTIGGVPAVEVGAGRVKASIIDLAADLPIFMPATTNVPAHLDPISRMGPGAAFLAAAGLAVVLLVATVGLIPVAIAAATLTATFLLTPTVRTPIGSQPVVL